jgi:hypothetical protein
MTKIIELTECNNKLKADLDAFKKNYINGPFEQVQNFNNNKLYEIELLKEELRKKEDELVFLKEEMLSSKIKNE